MLLIHTLHLRMANAYLIENQSGVFLVDTGMPGDERHIVSKMETLGRDDLKLIVLTHAHLDHFGSASAIKRLTGALIAIHRADAEALAKGKTNLGEVHGRGRLIRWILPVIEHSLRFETQPADILLEDGDDLLDYGLSATIIHTPGHTPGSISLLIEDQHAFVGDLISTNGVPHAQKYYASDWSQISQSLRRLQSFKPQTIYPGHGRKPMNGENLNLLCTKIR